MPFEIYLRLIKVVKSVGKILIASWNPPTNMIA